MKETVYSFAPRSFAKLIGSKIPECRLHAGILFIKNVLRSKRRFAMTREIKEGIKKELDTLWRVAFVLLSPFAALLFFMWIHS
jgi:hypothetical protein